MIPSNKFFNWLKLAKTKVFNPFKSSKDYWEKWYKKNRDLISPEQLNSTEYKTQVVNDWLKHYNIDSVIDLGCGIGNYIDVFNGFNYMGYDVSETAIKICQNKYGNEQSKTFKVIEKIVNEKSNMTMSIDVIYYLVEDDVFVKYMNNLFNSSQRYVMIYSTNHNHYNDLIPHIKHRQFTDWVKKHKKEFVMINHLKNDSIGIAQCEFYLFEKMILK